MGQLTLHMGLPKTATTTMQKHLFPCLPGIAYLSYSNDPGHEYHEGLAHIFGAIHRPNADNREQVRALTAFCNQSDRDVLISDESLTFPCMRSIADGPQSYSCPASLFESLQTVFGRLDREIRVVLTLRKQVELLWSFYATDWRANFQRHPAANRYDNWLELVLGRPGGSEFLRYDVLVEAAQGVFGASNVSALLFEELAEDQALFITRLSTFLGHDFRRAGLIPLPKENAGRVAGKSRLITRTDAFALVEALVAKSGYAWSPATHQRLSFLRKLKWKARVDRAPRLESRLQDSLRDSNVRFAEMTGYDLERYGYFD